MFVVAFWVLGVGYRAQAAFHDGRVTIYSRRSNDWTARFGPIGAALQHLPANGFVIDGAVVIPDNEWRPNFGWLQADLAAGRTEARSIMPSTCCGSTASTSGRRRWSTARACPAGILQKTAAPDRVQRAFRDRGRRALRPGVQARRGGPHLEGSPRATPALAAATNWIKVKCWQRREIRRRGVRAREHGRNCGSSRLGEMRDGKLMYAGKVGTGWGRAMVADIRRRMDALVRKTSPLDERSYKETRYASGRTALRGGCRVLRCDLDDGRGATSFHGLSLAARAAAAVSPRPARPFAQARKTAARRSAAAFIAASGRSFQHVQEGRRKRRACRPEGCYRSSRGRANYPVRVPTPYKHRTPMRSTSSGPRKMKAYGLFSDWKKDQSLSN